MNTSLNKTSLLPGSPARAPAALTRLLTDRVVLGFTAGILLLAALDPSRVAPSAAFSVRSLLGIAPYLLLAVGLAAFLRASGADQLVARAFAGHSGRSIVIASLAGALSPFCSCGVVPIIAGLLRARVPLAPVMAFWITSPIMDPEMFILTAAGIDLEFAVARVIATVALGLMAGYAVHAMRGLPAVSAPLRPDTASGGCAAPLSKEPIQWRFWNSAQRRGVFGKELAGTSLFLGKWLALAFFIESLMIHYVPAERVAAILGSGAWYEVPVAAIVGIPAYLNGYAAIPLVDRLMEMGMNPGAAMAFMTAGAVSSIPAAMAVAVLVRRPVFAVYLLLGLGGAMLTGVLYAALSL